MTKYNPTKVSFSHPTQFTDGSAFGESDYAGTEFAVREVGAPEWTPTVAIPVSFSQSEVPLSDLSLPKNVELEMTARTVASNGAVSEWAAPSNSFVFDTRLPLAPSAVAVS